MTELSLNLKHHRFTVTSDLEPIHKILIGKKFNRLTIDEIYGLKRREDGRCLPRYCKCTCECGIIKTYALYAVKSGSTKSCGCKKIEACIIQMNKIHELYPSAKKSHGMSETKVYAAWLSIKKRCKNKTYHGYKNYGGRGIHVCSEWDNSFESFYEHIGDPPKPEHLYSVDRIDVNNNYQPGNVRWATVMEQAQNKRRNASNHPQELSQT